MMAQLKGLAALAALILAVTAVPAAGACTVYSYLTLPFGTYDWQNIAPTDGVGTIPVECDVSTTFVVALGPGSYGTINNRVFNGSTFSYNLYTNASRSTIWGDGVTGGSTVSATGTSVNLSVYGRIPAGQNPNPGVKQDTVSVTVTF